MKNKAAQSRYHVIDEALRNNMTPPPCLKKFRKLIFEKTGLYVCTSSIQKDIEAMRYDQALGYNAPIVYNVARGGYEYSDPDFTINIHELMARIKSIKNLNNAVLP